MAILASMFDWLLGITSLATRKASSGFRTRPSLPGTVGTPAACKAMGICYASVYYLDHAMQT